VTTGFEFKHRHDISLAGSVEEALKMSLESYLEDRLGRGPEVCQKRVQDELVLRIPRLLLDGLEVKGWCLDGKRILDVGAGFGGIVLEAKARGADPVAVEPAHEFAQIIRLRQLEASHKSTVVRASGDNLPFLSNQFDYVITCQVLEHVRNIPLLLREIHRVLKPGGEAFLSCENYLTFWEPHYDVLWFPLLPKYLGSIYLQAIGRNPGFLMEQIHYTTYPGLRKQIRESGLIDITHDRFLDGYPRLYRVVMPFIHLRNTLRIGSRILVKKPS